MPRPTIPAGYPMHTPWGGPDNFKLLAEGIASYSTPSHGGIWLSVARRKELPKSLQAFMPYGGRAGWYEEDCDWAVVALAFPAFFTAEQINAAEGIFRMFQPCYWAAFEAEKDGAHA